ncbi:hypothetical protein [Methyloligella solikamskensis]|uniref:Uncharacterized protein n=1 Tax=Methyloligella solikamskensis TaxID=1177756 RepID=A0ABW3J8A2_9HYPH
MTNRGETPPDTDNTPIEGSPFTPRQVRILKIAVIVMGVLLVAGFLLIIATIAFQATQMGVEEDTTPAIEQASPPAGEQKTRKAFDVTIPDGAEVVDMTVDGNRLVLHLKIAEGGDVLVIDLTDGKVISRIGLRPE